jgi:metal transporter CNNM
MPPTVHISTTRHTSHLAVTLLGVLSNHVPTLLDSLGFHRRAEGSSLHRLAKRAEEAHGKEKIIYAILIPVLVLLSGLFAGLTLGYVRALAPVIKANILYIGICLWMRLN